MVARSDASSSRPNVAEHVPLKPRIDVVIITLNEERNIAECLASAAAADRVIVIDSGSTDRTREIAAAAGATVCVRPFTNFADQRNFALSLATSDWVLHLDADERVTAELWRELTAAIAQDGVDAFLVPTLNFFAGAALRHGGWYPQYHLRLQRRARTRWVGDVHETARVDGVVERLTQPILHKGHPNIATIMAKVDRSTTIDAARLTAPAGVLALRAVLEPVPYFLYKYVLQRGFLDGWRGVAMAALLAWYRCLMYLKALERTAQTAEHA